MELSGQMIEIRLAEASKVDRESLGTDIFAERS
jgi:hypothetical protein